MKGSILFVLPALVIPVFCANCTRIEYEPKPTGPAPFGLIDRYQLRSSTSGDDFGAWLRRDALSRKRELPRERRRLIQRLYNRERAFASFLRYQSDDAGLPRWTVGLFRGQVRVFRARQGVDFHSRRPLASVSKIITATAVLQLVEKNKLALNDDIAIYLPDFTLARETRGGVRITVADLLQHSSGIPYDGDRRHVVRSPARDMRFRISSQFQAAGKSARYSNQNFYLAGAVIESAAGQSYPAYVHEHIFEPLGMNNSRVLPRANAASGIESSVQDLLLFYRQLMHPNRHGGRPISAASLTRMTELPAYEKDPRRTGAYWGLGLRIRYHGGKQLELYHNGRWTGAGGRLGYFPAEDTYLIYLGEPDDFRDREYRAFHNNIAYHASRYARDLDRLLK